MDKTPKRSYGGITEPREKLPINITFEIVQLPEPNSHWYEVTAVLTWEEAGYTQRMDTALCTQLELSSIKEATCFLVGHHFDIRGVKEECLPFPEEQRREGNG
jgi:hypothetical protein